MAFNRRPYWLTFGFRLCISRLLGPQIKASRNIQFSPGPVGGTRMQSSDVPRIILPYPRREGFFQRSPFQTASSLSHYLEASSSSISTPSLPRTLNTNPFPFPPTTQHS